MTNTKKQTDRILDYLRENGSITQLEALRECGVMRLASRISDLKKSGVNISSKTESGTNKYGKYSYARYYLA